MKSANDQLTTANDIVVNLQKANIQSLRFEELIINYRKLISKYLHSISLIASKSENNQISSPTIEEGIKASSEYKMLLKVCEEQKNKYNTQLTINNKALGDIIEMKNELDNIDKTVTVLLENVKTTKHELHNNEKKTKKLQSEINQHQKTIKDNEGFEKQIIELNKKLTEKEEEHETLNQHLKILQSTLNDQMNQTDIEKKKAEIEKRNAEIMFIKKEEQFKSIVYTNNNPEMNDSSSSKTIEIPRNLKLKVIAHQKGITALSFDSKGDYLLSSSIDGSIKNWDCMTHKETNINSEFKEAVSEVEFDHSDQYLFAGSIDRTAKLLHLGSNKIAQTFTGHNDFINCVKCFPMSMRALTGSSDRTIKEWDFNSEKNVGTLKCSSSCNALSIVQDESIIFSGHSDGNVYLWSSKDKYQNKIELHDDKVLHLQLLDNQINFVSISKYNKSFYN